LLDSKCAAGTIEGRMTYQLPLPMTITLTESR
jgi:hypothetical protein